jgi:hypothetical protein
MDVLITLLTAAIFLTPTQDEAVMLSVNTRMSPDHIRHLLIEVTGPADLTVDKITLRSRNLETGSSRTGTLPPGWVYDRGRSRIKISGPPQNLPVRARIVIGHRDVPIQLKAVVRSGRKKIYDRDNLIRGARPAVKVSESLKGLLVLPPLIFAGDTIECKILNPAATPPDGLWTIAGQTMKAERWQPPNSTASDWWLRFKAPASLTPDQPIRVSYADAFGLKTVNAVADQVRVVAVPGSRPEQARLVKCSPRGLVGGGICVVGWFPDRAARGGLLLDDKPTPYPLAVSSVGAFLTLPIELSPGQHHISGASDAGFATGLDYTVEIITVQAEIDRSQLVEGLSTDLTFFVVGSNDPLSVRVTNTTPEIVTLSGGNEQIIETFGGGGNIVTREVETLSLGNFEFRYELAEPRCPCLDSLPAELPVRLPPGQ